MVVIALETVCAAFTQYCDCLNLAELLFSLHQVTSAFAYPPL